MDLKEAKQIVNASIRNIRWALQLQDWTIVVEYKRLDPGNLGNCCPDPDYRKARIQIDNDQIENRKQLLDTLLHEHLHVMHAQFEVYRRAVLQYVPAGAAENAVEVVWRNAVEVLVTRLEAMLQHGLGLNSEALAQAKDWDHPMQPRVMNGAGKYVPVPITATRTEQEFAKDGQV